MFSISHDLQTHIFFNGRRYALNTAFDVVLRVFDLQRDDLFSPVNRVEIAVDILAGSRAGKLRLNSKVHFFENAIELLVGKGQAATGPRVMDFAQDAQYIYASFMQAYGIDLLKMRGTRGALRWKRARLDWREFMALFQGLPDDTKIKEIMSVRQRPIPARTKHNGAEIDALMKAKTFYALKIGEEEAETTFQRGVDRLAASLASRAKGE